jgi:hypothetical protein
MPKIRLVSTFVDALGSILDLSDQLEIGVSAVRTPLEFLRFVEALRVPVNDACAVIPLEDRGITENATEDSVRDLQVGRKRISPRAVYGINSGENAGIRAPLMTDVLSTYGLMLMRRSMSKCS